MTPVSIQGTILIQQFFFFNLGNKLMFLDGSVGEGGDNTFSRNVLVTQQV